MAIAAPASAVNTLRRRASVSSLVRSMSSALGGTRIQRPADEEVRPPRARIPRRKVPTLAIGEVSRLALRMAGTKTAPQSTARRTNNRAVNRGPGLQAYMWARLQGSTQDVVICGFEQLRWRKPGDLEGEIASLV